LTAYERSISLDSHALQGGGSSSGTVQTGDRPVDSLVKIAKSLSLLRTDGATFLEADRVFPTTVLGGSAIDPLDAEVGAAIGGLLRHLLPVDPYPRLAFHVHTKKDVKQVLGLKDQDFYVDARIAPEDVTGSEVLRRTAYSKLAENLPRDVPTQFKTWLLRPDDRAELALLVGSIGSGKSTFLKHSMVEWINNPPKDHRRLFLYLDCNDDAGAESRQIVGRAIEGATSADALTAWERWIANEIAKEVVFDFVSEREGNLDRLTNTLCDFPPTELDFKARVGTLNPAGILKELLTSSPRTVVQYFLWYLRKHHADEGYPTVVVDNTDVGGIELQVAAMDFLHSLTRKSNCKTVIALRTANLRDLSTGEHLNRLSVVNELIDLPPPDLEEVCAKRVGKLESELSPEMTESSELAQTIRGLRNVVVRPSGSEAEERHDFYQNMNNILKGVLSKETKLFLWEYSNHNLRTAMNWLSNFFDVDTHITTEWGLWLNLLAKDPEPGTVKPWRFKKSLLTWGTGAFLSTGADPPLGPVNIFWSRHGCSPLCRRFLGWSFLAELLNRQENNVVQVGGEDFRHLARLCPGGTHIESLPEALQACLGRVANHYLDHSLVESSVGARTIQATFSRGGTLGLTALGRFHVKKLVNDLDYISAMRYDGTVPGRWSHSWENPRRRPTHFWVIASNAEFADIIAEEEEAYRSLIGVASKNRKILSTGVCRAVQHSLGDYEESGRRGYSGPLVDQVAEAISFIESRIQVRLDHLLNVS
jgi:hypothetical protein